MIQALEGAQSKAPAVDGSNVSFKAHLQNAKPIINSTLPKALKARVQHFEPLVQEISQNHGVNPKLVKAVILQESGFNPKATSKAGAQGLMQLMPVTAKSLGVKDPYDPVQNMDGGVRHLKTLLNSYNGNIPLALAAYNAGSGAVKKYNGIPPYQETQNYVKSILGKFLKS
ncbi:MAG: lytic transglycosylase domain-containing protein [Vampirovibrio sp.]|nr:lytic transglycosylase domain-containing protein [Vampirovibrio sp.]